MRFIYISILLFSTSVSTSYSQNRMGIKTLDPQGIVHIDSKENTSGSTSTEDDFIIDNDGNVGLGTLLPTKKLDVNGNMLITGNDTINGNTAVNGTISINGLLKYGNSTNTPKAKVDIESSNIKGAFRLSNGTQNQTTTPPFIPVLTIDNNNDAIWGNLPVFTEVKNAIVKTSGNVLRTNPTINQTTADNNNEITNGVSGRIILTAGIWFLNAKCVIGTVAATASSDVAGNGTKGNYVFLHILDESNTTIASSGALPESSGLHIGIPQVSSLYVIPTGTTKTLRLVLRSDFYETSTTTTTRKNQYQIYSGSWTSPYFYAVRLDFQNP